MNGMSDILSLNKDEAFQRKSHRPERLPVMSNMVRDSMQNISQFFVFLGL